MKYWLQRLERAHIDTERAARQYNAVEPENRLVARTLERKWEETLNTELELKAQYEHYLLEQPTVLSEVSIAIKNRLYMAAKPNCPSQEYFSQVVRI